MENNEIKGQEGLEPSLEDLKNASVIFAQALNLILQDKQGIVVDVNSKNTFPDSVKKIVVFKLSGQINIFKCEDDIEEGTFVNIEEQN